MKTGDYILIGAILFFLLVWKRSGIISFFARFSYGKGDTAKALQLFELAEKIGGMNSVKMIDYGYLCLRMGDTEKAGAILRKAYGNEKKPILKKRVNSILALVLWREGNLDGAIDMLEGVLEGFKETTVYQNLGVFYNLKGGCKKALEFNKEAYSFNSDDLGIMDNLAQSHMLCGNFDEAEKLYEKILENEPNFPEPYYGCGTLLCERGEMEKGIKLIEKALEKNYSYLSVKSRDEVMQILQKYKN